VVNVTTLSGGAVSGNGAGLTAINASNVSTGTIANARTTAATANGASTIVLRGASGEFSAGAITGASFTGNGAAISAINGSNVSTGTVANARTTASDANGASTIVSRNASGSFTANIITANGSAISAINGSNVTTGTVANARTTAASANGASTIVARDANGSFAANVITATLSGNATNVTGIVAIANGGTGANTAPAGLTNLRGWSTTATAAGTTTLTNTSTTQQNFTGSTTQTVVLPVTSTLALGWAFEIINNSTGTVTVNSSGGNLVGTVIAGTTASIVCNLTSGTDAASWDFDIDGFATETGTGSVVRATSPTLVSPALGTPTALVGTNISSINASNLSSGTVANARTTAATANGASTIVLRGTSGEFTAGAITGASFTGSGSGLTSIPNSATTAASANGASTIVARDANGSFTANVGTFTTVSGAGGGLTGINASNISTGTIANARTTASDANGASTIVSRSAAGSFTANVITATTFSGSGASLTSIPNSATTAASANGASTIVARDANGSFTANVGTFTTVSGAGGGLTGINASNISTGTIANARTTAASANGASTIVARDASGNFTANAITATNFIGGGASISALNGSNVTTGTVANARTTAATANGASTIVLRGTSGEFTAGAITGASFTGSGTALSAINASNLSSGTVATARLATGTANATTYLRGDQTWATVSGGITLTNDTTTNASYYVTLTTATSGSISAANVSNTKLFFNPSTGTLTATVHTSNSDERLKENWTDVAPDFVSKLAQVKHGVFSRKDSGNREPGVGAQSFMTVLPEAVVEGADGYLSVNYGGAALVSAIELAKVVEKLQAEIAELRAELKAK
jgi:hypothetical protein